MAYVPAVAVPNAPTFKVQSAGTELADITALNMTNHFTTTKVGNTAEVWLAANSFVRNIYAVPIAAASGGSVISYDNTTPSATEGTAVSNIPLVPMADDSKFLINYTMMVDCSAARNLILAVFRNTTYIGGTVVNFQGSARPQSLSLNLLDTFASTVSRTYTLRAGLSASGTWFINRQNTSYFNGGLAKNIAQITEVL